MFFLTQLVAIKFNSMPGYIVTMRAVGDRFTHLSRRQKSKNNNDAKASGLGGDEKSQFDTLREDLIQLIYTKHKN